MTAYETYRDYNGKPFMSYKGIPIERFFHGHLGRNGLTGHHVYTAKMPDGSIITRQLLKDVKREIVSIFFKGESLTMKKIKHNRVKGWRGYENGRWVLDFWSKSEAESWLNAKETPVVSEWVTHQQVIDMLERNPKESEEQTKADNEDYRSTLKTDIISRMEAAQQRFGRLQLADTPPESERQILRCEPPFDTQAQITTSD